MNDLSIHVRNKQLASIKYDDKAISIDQRQWDPVFGFLLKDFESAYFLGHRHNYMDNEFEKTVFYLCEEVLCDVDDPPINLLFRIKEASFLYNRILLSKMWSYYEFPYLIFSYERSNEKTLIDMIEDRCSLDEIVSSINSLTVLYPTNSFWDFLWIKCSADRPDLFFLKNN